MSSFGTTSTFVSTKPGSGPTLSSRDAPAPLRVPSVPSLRRLILAPNSGSRFSCSLRWANSSSTGWGKSWMTWTRCMWRAALQFPPHEGHRLLPGAVAQGSRAPALEVDLVADGQVALELLGELVREGGRLHAQRRLVVQLEGAVVEVDRADRGPRAVDDQRLGVQH